MLVRALKLELVDGGTLVSALNSLVAQKWSDNIVNGQMILSTSEASGSVYWLDGTTLLDANALIHLFDLER